MLRLRDIGQFLLLLPLLIIILLNTDLGCLLVKRLLENELSQRFGAKIEIGNFDFTFPYQITLSDLDIQIDQEASVHIRKTEIKTSLTALLGGQLSRGELEFSDIQYKQALLKQLNVRLNSAETTRKWIYTLNGDAGNCGMIEANGAFEIGVSAKEFSASMACHLPALDILSPLISNAVISGQGSINLSLHGSWHNHKLGGELTIRHGCLEHLKSGALFTQITVDGKFQDDRFILHSFSAFDHQRKRVEATGSMDFDLEKNFPFSVNLRLDRARVINLADMESHVSGDLVFSGNLLGASIKGDLQVNDLELYLRGGKSKNGHQLEITYINQPFEKMPVPVKPVGKKEWPLQLDLHFYNAGNISILDDQLTSLWSGDLKITGTSEAPLMHGDCRLKQGEYLFNGRKFKLTQGTISFIGDLAKKTQLYVVGEQEVASIKVEVILKGPLDDLALAFRSTPQLSEKEILCRLLFGRGTAEITPFQGAELTESINKLKTQGGGGPDFFNRIKKSFGIDRIDISHDYGSEKEEISLQVGKYLSPSIFIGITKGITAEGNRIGIEADLKNNLKFQAEIGDNKEGQVHLKWKHDY